MKEKTSHLEKLERVAEAVPDYPGRETLEKAVAVPLRPLATKFGTALVMRMIGYWHAWSIVPGGRAGIVDRGWMSRRAAYQAEADFRRVFGCSVEDFDPKMLPVFLLGHQDEDSA